MAGPAHPFRSALLLATCLGPLFAAAQSPTPAPAPAEPAASPKLQRLFPDSLPKYEPTAAPQPAAPAATRDVPRNTIVRLPAFVVHDRVRLPDEYEIVTQKGREAAMAKRYLGPQGTLDRALNAVTLADMWKAIPLLGRLPFVPFDSRTYDQRAALIYDRPEKKRRFEELMSIERAAQAAEKPAAPNPPPSSAPATK